MNVDVGTVKRSELSGLGTTAGGRDFSIALQCGGATHESGNTKIQVSFSGNLAAGTTNAQGVLQNEKTSTSGAKGVGIQVLKDGAPLDFTKVYNVGDLADKESRYYSIPLSARFYKYSTPTTAGEVESHMIFNLTYE